MTDLRPPMLILAASLLCAVFVALQAPSYDAEITEGTCGDDATWSFDSETGTLTIDGTGEMDNYRQNEMRSPWADLPVKKAIIGKDITRIGANAFFRTYTDTAVLEELVLQEDSRLEAIGATAFAGWSKNSSVFNKIASVHIGPTVNTIEQGAFQNCRSLVTVTMDEGVESIGENAFDNTAIESVIIPDSVTHIAEFAFAYCPNLKDVTVGDNAESVYRAFEGSDAIENLRFGASITSIVLVGDICYLPPRVASLPWGMISHGNIATQWDYVSVLTEAYMWGEHGNGPIYIDGEIPATVREFVVDPANPVFTARDGVLYNRDMTELILYPAAKEGDHLDIPRGVRVIGNTAIWDTKLSSVTIPDTVTSIGAYAIRVGESITVPSSVTSLGERSVVARVININASVPVLSWLNVSQYAEVMNLGKGIQALDLSITPRYYVYSDAKTIYISWDPNNIFSSLCEINVDPANQVLSSKGGVLYSRDGRQLLCVPPAMAGDTFIMPNSVEYMSGGQPEIGRFVGGAVHGGWAVITDPGYRLSAGLFQCTKFTTVVLSDNLLMVGSAAFYENTYIEKIKIPASVIKVGERAFEAAANVKWIYLEGKLPSVGYHGFYFGTRYVPVSVNMYSLIESEGFLDRYAGVNTSVIYNTIEEEQEVTKAEEIMGNPVYVLAGLGLISLGMVAFEVMMRRRR